MRSTLKYALQEIKVSAVPSCKEEMKVVQEYFLEEHQKYEEGSGGSSMLTTNRGKEKKKKEYSQACVI